mmetsp:Transcript_33198/g.73254  ORF Transcript_33198/g.73254 Transcript_33198/m.73254 type:complete len:366 (+) Transcript_33198:59-1156(+)
MKFAAVLSTFLLVASSQSEVGAFVPSSSASRTKPNGVVSGVVPSSASSAAFNGIMQVPLDNAPRLRLSATTDEATEAASTKVAESVVDTSIAAAGGAAVAVASSAGAKTPSKMDERIFTLNKIIIDRVYDLICFFYPVKGNDRDFARFFVLETVARVPYFAYLSVLHLRETFGQRTTDGTSMGEEMSDRMRTHYAEADNELHHLLIMEELGGNSNPVDRLLAQSMAFGYYWYVIVVYFLSEQAAYHLSELIEDHAFETYDGFLKNHGDRLKKMPVPAIASKYYEKDNPFLFDLFCTVKEAGADGTYSARRPELKSLYDVFVNIRDDEREHWKTLCNLVQFNDMQGCDASVVKSTEPRPVEPAAAA